jgi:AcrR family transcriptional regulator
MAQRGGPEAERRARGEETRLALIAAARELFADPGYFETSATDIVRRAGVGTRGAFYHHFADKAELFRVVFEEVEQDLIRRGLSTPGSGDQFERLVQAFHGFLDGALQPEVQRIMLVDGTAVLGWETRRSIEADNSIAAIEAVLQKAMDEGTIEQQPTRELAHILVGALEEAALLVARAADGARARAASGRVIDQMLAGLAPAGHGRRRALRRA